MVTYGHEFGGDSIRVTVEFDGHADTAAQARSLADAIRACGDEWFVEVAPTRGGLRKEHWASSIDAGAFVGAIQVVWHGIAVAAPTLAATADLAVMIQKIGRWLRRTPDGKATRYVDIVDRNGNVLRRVTLKDDDEADFPANAALFGTWHVEADGEHWRPLVDMPVAGGSNQEWQRLFAGYCRAVDPYGCVHLEATDWEAAGDSGTGNRVVIGAEADLQWSTLETIADSAVDFANSNFTHHGAAANRILHAWRSDEVIYNVDQLFTESEADEVAQMLREEDWL